MKIYCFMCGMHVRITWINMQKFNVKPFGIYIYELCKNDDAFRAQLYKEFVNLTEVVEINVFM